MRTIPFIAKRLRALREHHGLTQEQSASLVGVGYKYYQLLESGTKKQVWVETVARFSDAYGIAMHEFFAPDFPTGTKLRDKRPVRNAHYKKKTEN